MTEALLTLLPTPMIFPPITSVVPSELAIDCGVDIVSEDSPFCVPCPAFCPCGFAAFELAVFELPPLLNEEFPNDEFLPDCGCDCPLPNSDPNPPLLSDELELCPFTPRGRFFRLPISCPFGPT